MFLGRSESIKWIRRKFSKRNNTNSSANIEHTPAKISKTSNENAENIRDLNEILVVKYTPTNITPVSVNNSKKLTTIHNNNEVMSTTTTASAIPTNQTAPIAREEEAEEEEDGEIEVTFENQRRTNEMESKDVGVEYQQEQQQQSHEINEFAVRRDGSGSNSSSNIGTVNAAGSKSSRVRNYLKKCKDRWLAVGLHNQMQEYSNNTGHDPKSTMSTINELDVSQDLRPITATKVTVISNNRLYSMGGVSGDSVNKGTLINCALGNCAKEVKNENDIDDDDEEDVDDDDDVVDESYEDIDFGLGSALSKTTTKQTIKRNNTITTSTTNQNDVCKSVKIETRQEKKHLKSLAQQQEQNHDNNNVNIVFDEKHVEQLADSLQMESRIAVLIDRHLAYIYPVFTQTTRAVLIREARDVLVNIYHGCLTTFERQFLCKFADIAVILKERHRVGEALIWCQGWPLVTPIGEVILHLGGLDDDQVKSAEIYLCVKTAEANKEPQLYAVWRTPTDHPLIDTLATSRKAAVKTQESGSTLKSCQLDYQDHTLYLSTLALEMLSDDLPQLLQNLLIGVENSLERLSLNQLPQIPYNGGDNITSSSSSATTTTLVPPSSSLTLSSSLAKNEKNHYGSLNGRLQLPNSPKCALRRSELITKNKLHNNKYMLRRLTNRQDSMNSTSSGNSSASGLSSASSDSDSYAKSHHLLNTNNNRNINVNNNNNNNSSNNINNNSNTISNNNHKIIATTITQPVAATVNATTTITQNETKTNELNSPALPRFCLGNSFPHIDSDEENPEDKRNSLTDDQLESEIIPPNLITDLPEKLLLSGIYLPGTRDLKGNPLVTVDAESVITAGLNCYEIATLLLYYSTIPECCVQSSNHLNGKTISNAAQRSQPVTMATTAKAPTATTTTLSPQTLQTSNQLTTSQYAATNTQLSTKTTVTTSTKATCTSLNDNNNIYMQQTQTQIEQQQQQHQQQVTFTILIAIEKSQHLCVIDLISQSLKLLTRHIAYCELLAICLDSNLLPTTKITTTTTNKAPNADNNDDHVNGNSYSNITPNTTSGNGSSSNNNNISELTKLCENQKSTDSNGNDCSLSNNKKFPQYTIKFISIDEVTTSVAPSQTPSGRLCGLHHHDARKWRDFFIQYEPFYNQCTGAAHRLVAALNDIRCADLQGLPTRRQLYAQHRALSRALMDSELHNLRKRSTATMLRLQELAKTINSNNNANNSSISNSSGTGGGYGGSYKTTSSICSGSIYNRNKIIGSGSSSSSYSFNYQSNQNQSQISHNISTIGTKSSSILAAGTTTSTSVSSKQASTATILQTQITATNPIIKSSIYSSNLQTSSTNPTSRVSANYTNSSSSSSNFIHNINNNNNNNNNNVLTTVTIGNIDVAIRLQKVTLLFNEIDRAAKRLEQLTEQRREHLRELTRQRALEDEINEVTSWITSDGNESLQRFINLELDFDTPMKELEHEFEKYYFISMKHLAKGRDLNLAAGCMESLKDSSMKLKNALDSFSEKLEIARERIEGATRLYHLIHLNTPDENMLNEMERLAGQYGTKGLLEKYHEKENDRLKAKPDTLNLHINHNSLQKTITQMITSTPDNSKQRVISHRSSYGTGSFESPPCQCWRDSRNLDEMDEMLDNDEEEGRSKIADSGVGECQRCEGNPKFTRVCSCQSLNEESENLYEKQDELDDECYEQTSKHYINVHSPWEANKHLQCFASTFELPKLEELSCLDPKIQKTLLLIMREMIGTERDYVRSLYYVIENYIDELLRDDIPQSLRGQRNVIFGNIEKIFEFHNNHFLAELERYEHNPLKVGAAFLQMESKFYLYALYNKNKPKSDTLMSEYGTAFFKTKQIELNDKMDLASYLLKPVQRMGKYALLLQQLVKACSTVEGSALQEIAADVEELQKAEEMVKFQLRHGNDLLAMDSLRDCDVNVKEQGRLLRQNEFLVWQGKGGKKTLRQIFLFEELVLFSKARRFPDHKNLDIYIYKNSIKTSDIGLTAHVGDSPTKFEIWFRKRKPEDTFTLQCMSEDIKNAWTEEISKLLWQQAKRNREIRLAEMSSMGIGSKPCLDIRPSNNQINDRSITISQLGKAPKLRHSFVGLHTDQIKTSRRPNSLISESSLSSGTSSSSLSKSSTSSSSSSSAHHHHNHQTHQPNAQPYHTTPALELISECQTLALENCNDSFNRSQQQLMTNTLSSGFSSHSGGGTLNSKHRNHHKRSTTIVSQLSMDVIVSPITGCQKYYTLKCHTTNSLGKKMDSQQQQHHHHVHHQHLHQSQQYKELKSEEIVEHTTS
ncbi:puratrophin-1-like isoform 2-T3 [Cochliomyia hominivorax]